MSKIKLGILKFAMFIFAIILVNNYGCNEAMALGNDTTTNISTTNSSVDPYQIGRDTYLVFDGISYPLYNDEVAKDTNNGITNCFYIGDDNQTLIIVRWSPNMDFTKAVNFGFADNLNGVAGIPEVTPDIDSTLTASYNEYFMSGSDKYVASLKKKYKYKFTNHIKDLDYNGLLNNIDTFIYAASHTDKDHQWYGVLPFTIN